jgi:hypothetical protein
MNERKEAMWVAVILSCLGATAETCTPAINSKLFDSKVQCEDTIADVRKYLEDNTYYSRAGCISVEKRGQDVGS